MQILAFFEVISKSVSEPSLPPREQSHGIALGDMQMSCYTCMYQLQAVFDNRVELVVECS